MVNAPNSGGDDSHASCGRFLRSVASWFHQDFCPGIWRCGGQPSGGGALTRSSGANRCGVFGHCVTGLGVGTRKIRRCSVKTNSWPRWLPRWMPFLPAPVPRRPLNPQGRCPRRLCPHGGCHATGQAPQAQPRAWANSSGHAGGHPAYQRWVDAIEIAGPGFLNIRLARCQAGSGA